MVASRARVGVGWMYMPAVDVEIHYYLLCIRGVLPDRLGHVTILRATRFRISAGICRSDAPALRSADLLAGTGLPPPPVLRSRPYVSGARSL